MAFQNQSNAILVCPSMLELRSLSGSTVDERPDVEDPDARQQDSYRMDMLNGLWHPFRATPAHRTSPAQRGMVL